MSVTDLLGGSQFAKKFIGGSVMRCILKPTSYHHFHSPVTGAVVESKEDVAGLYFTERTLDSPARYRRGYVVYDTAQYGKVAMATIGLATIGSVVYEPTLKQVRSSKPVSISKGEMVGNFAYGGSMIILLFEPGVIEAVSVQQGQQIGVLRERIGL